MFASWFERAGASGNSLTEIEKPSEFVRNVTDAFEHVFDTLSMEQGAGMPDVAAIVEQLRMAVRELHPGAVTPDEAAEFVEAFAEGERLCAAAKAMAARVVERSGLWRGEGHRTAAHWMAERTGVAVGQAVGTLETARRLEHLPRTAEAFRSGQLSETKVKEVAAAAAVDPASERSLLDLARTETIKSLREKCQEVKARAAIDENEAYERIHRRRFLRHWTDMEGAFRLEARLTPDDGARVMASIRPRQERIAREARKAGSREPSEAYAADALASLASDNSSGCSRPQTMVHVRVDHSALARGDKAKGEICEIPGIGPIPVAVARRLSSDSVLKVLVTGGCDVKAVAHAGRTIPTKIRTALEARDQTCVVPGCDVRDGLEIDHIIPFAEGGLSTLENLARLCKWHHYLKTHCGYRLEGPAGHRTWVGPDPPSR